jgi:YHS domain-containing protein
MMHTTLETRYAAIRSDDVMNARKRPQRLVQDPVCGMQLSRGRMIGPVVHERQEFFFCSEACRGKFKADPAQWATREAH